MDCGRDHDGGRHVLALRQSGDVSTRAAEEQRDLLVAAAVPSRAPECKRLPRAGPACDSELMSTPTRSAASSARRSPVFRAAARVGFAVNGLLNIVIGAIAMGVIGGSAGGADPNGALAGLAQGPGGQVLVWVTAVGMAALGLWQFGSAALEREPDRRRRWMSRAKLVGKGIAYVAISIIAIRVALRGSSGGGSTEEDLTATALRNPGGVVLIVLVGLGAVAVGAYLVVKGIKRRFLEDVTLPGGTLGTATTWLGIVGYVARGIAIAIIGVLFIAAALTADPSKAGGLDDALAALAALPFGKVLLIGIGLGFLASGLYSIVRAKYAKL